MRILDLFCGAGLVHDGLRAAGFHVTGVDLHKHAYYPGPFLQHDALTLDPRYLDDFDAIWASPPCLRETVLKHAPGAKGDEHPELITPTQRMLDAWAARTGGLFVIENVPNTKLLRRPVILCGSMFGLGVDDHGRRYQLQRHRKFEANWSISVGECRHQQPVIGVYGGHCRCRAASAGGRGTKDPWTLGHQGSAQAAMGIGRYIPVDHIDQGIPPVYAEFIGRQLRHHVMARKDAA